MDTDEPDEFARLLAQLNAPPAPAPAPADAAPAAAPAEPTPPVFAPPPAPAMPPPGIPDMLTQPPVMSTPAAMPAPAAQIPVAPAFGVAAPYPTLAVAPVAPDPVAPAPIIFPTVAPLPVDVAPMAPPPPRAPELMGADELAAPPRSLPAYDDVPPLVSPPAFDVPPAPDAQPASDAQPAFGAPAAQQPPQAFSPPPSAPVSSPAAASAARPEPAVQAPAPRALDFASLLSTPAGADDDARVAGAPLTFASGPQIDDDDSDLGRSTTGEKIGLALAILVAPIGLIVGIVAAIRSANRRGWVVGIVRASIAIAVVLTLVWAIAGYFGYTQFKLQQAHDQTAAASSAFCAAIKANPGMDQLPTFGWPAVAGSIPDSLKAMQAYEDRWVKLAKVSPPGIKPGVTRVAAAAKKIIESVTVARTVDDPSNVATMSAVASSSGVPAWHSEYCG